MKVISLEKVKFAPGKWEEAGNVMKTFTNLAKRLGFPEYKIYGAVIGGDVVQTLHFKTEWESMAEMEALMEKMYADPEMREMMFKWSGVVSSHEITLLKELSEEELGI
jgi:hypothetical protein